MLSITNLDTNKSASLETNSLIMIKGATWDTYWNLSHEDLKVEFIDEVLYIHSPASLEHDRIFRKLMVILSNYISEMEIGGEILGSRFPIRLKDGKRVEPDLIYLAKQDLVKGKLTDTMFDGSPTFIVEIVSPEYRTHDTETKLQKYVELGVNEYWIIDPELKEMRVILIKNNKIVNDRLITEGSIITDLEKFKGLNVKVEEFWD